MPIVATDLAFYVSASTNTAGWQDSDNDGKGKYVSQTSVSTSNVFADVTGAQNFAGYTDYRCIFVRNGHGSLSLTNAKVWVESQASGGSDIRIGLDTTGASAQNSGSAQALTVADYTDSTNQLSGVTFATASSEATALSVGTLQAGYVKGIWLERVTNQSLAKSGDNVVLRVKGDTLP